MSGVPILLASASPRRRELFGHLGYPFTTCQVDADETPLPGEDAETMVMRLARVKAGQAREQCPEGLVIGADTAVEMDGAILGKPSSAEDARRMLARLSGREHRVWTAIAVLGPSHQSHVEALVTQVRFRPMSDAEIARYVASGEPMDKAGAYGIQERGAVFVSGIRGDYFTVVGLPLCRLSEILAGLIGPPPG